MQPQNILHAILYVRIVKYGDSKKIKKFKNSSFPGGL